MSPCRVFVMMLAATILPIAAFPYPEGAPWGAADPDAAENCTSCHFDYAATRDSPSVTIEGLPDSPVPGRSYELVIRFEDAEASAAGFQLLLRSPSGSAGLLSSRDAALESTGPGIRSTAPSNDGNGAAWRVTWTAPDAAGAVIRFFVAVTGANDDGSPFGDRVHFRTFAITP